MASLLESAKQTTAYLSELGRTGMALPTGAVKETLDILPYAGEATGQTIAKLGEGAGAGVYSILYNTAEGVSKIGTVGLAGLGEGAGSGIASFGKGAGTALENVGTGAGKGVTNLAVGAIPAALIAVGIILVLGLSKSVARG